ncbi:MAG: BatD family protein [Candidatus Eisenbacteria bacterium]
MTRTGSLLSAVLMATASLVAVTAFTATAAAADDITVSAFVDRTSVSVNQAVRLTVQVEGAMQSLPAPKLPPLEDAWNVQSGGTSSNMSWVNGRMSVSKSWTYNLLPKRTGALAIGAAEIEFEGSVYATEPITIDVVEGGAPAAGAASPGVIEERPSTGIDPEGRDIFIATSVDRKTAHVGEQITLSFKFYRRVSLFDQPRYEAPDLTGFWAESLGEVPEYYESVGGIRYRVIEIRTALFGAAAGPATIGPALLTYRKERPGFTFFSTGGQPVTLQTRPIDVEILPLPSEGRPDDFDGTVGRYRVTTSLDSRTVSELEPVTLTLKIEGTGNVRTVPEPTLPDLPDFKIYESGSSTQTTKNGSVGGVKRYEYVLVPQSSGRKTIPEFGLSFFDPAAGSYGRSDSRPITLDVTPGTGDGGDVELPVRAAISRLGRDVRYIREPAGSLRPAKRPLHTRPSFLMLQLVPLAAFAGAVAYRRRRDRFAGNEGLARHVRAPAAARKELREARTLAASGDAEGTCSSIARALTDLIGDRWNVQARGMTLTEIEGVIRTDGAEEELVTRVGELLRACDLGRFAAGEGSVEAERLIGEADACLRALERVSARRRRR